MKATIALALALEVVSCLDWNPVDSLERTGHGHLLHRDMRCLEDTDCCSYCHCVVTDPIWKRSECRHSGLAHLNAADDEGNQQEENTERGEFEIGYWCLKNSDCASKKCAQVGPRKYDKECQEKDYVDFVVPKKEKRKHTRRELKKEEEEDTGLHLVEEAKKLNTLQYYLQ